MRSNLLLFIEDARVFYTLVKKFKDKEIKWKVFESVAKLKYLPHANSLIVTEIAGMQKISEDRYFKDFKHRIKFLNYETFPNFRFLIIEIYKNLAGINNFSTLNIGIDPGQKNIGLAIFLDKTLISTELFHNDFEILECINEYIGALNPKYLNIKMGKGNLKSLRDLISILITDNIIKRPHLMVVDERRSSDKFSRKFKCNQTEREISRDEKAAIIIGSRAGTTLNNERIEKILQKEANLAELKIIQKQSRRMSNGEISISLKDARDVYLKKISLKNAIELKKKKIAEQKRNKKN